MAFSRLQRTVGLIGVSLALLATPVLAAPSHGEFSGGLYIAPGQLFTVKSPLGPRPTLADSFVRTTGAVSFMDDYGQLFGIVCTPDLDVLAGAAIDVEVATAILRNWFREAAFPMFFAAALPGASILRDEPGEFEGQPAWIAVLHLPRGSTTGRRDPATGQAIRDDAWRGVVVFSRGGQTYLLMTQLIGDSPGQGDQQFDASAAGWRDFLPRLAQFYHGMTFNESAGDWTEDTRVSGAGS